MKKEKGITLIALVITIIVLLILAGITILLAFPNNGIIDISKNAKKEYEEAQNNELAALNTFHNEIDSYISNVPLDAGNFLWKNPNMKDSFSSQTVELTSALENYDYIKIFWGSIDSVDTPPISYYNDVMITDNGFKTQLFYSFYMNVWSGHPLMYRYCSGENTQLTFEDAYSSGGGNNNTLNNSLCIPFYVIGYKF